MNSLSSLPHSYQFTARLTLFVETKRMIINYFFVGPICLTEPRMLVNLNVTDRLIHYNHYKSVDYRIQFVHCYYQLMGPSL